MVFFKCFPAPESRKNIVGLYHVKNTTLEAARSWKKIRITVVHSQYIARKH